MTRLQLVIRWVFSASALGVALAWLHRLGEHALAFPSPNLDDVTSWVQHTDPPVAAFTQLRLVAMCFAAYLFVVITLGFVSRILALPRMSALVSRCTIPFVRGLFGGAAFLGILAAPPPTPRPSHDRVTMHLLVDAPTPTSTSTPVVTAPTIADLPDDDNVWVVEHGDSLWSIASTHLAGARGRPVSDDEVSRYWRDLVDVNRPRLVNPADADLLFSGQEIELPAVV